MRTPFKISFKEKIKDNSDRNILEDFKNNFKDTYCDYIKIIDEHELIVKNDFIRWKPDMNLNLWVGISRAKITIEVDKTTNEKTIKYLIDFTRLTLTHIFTLLIFSLFIIVEGDFDLRILSLLTIIIASISVVTHLIAFLRHRSIFKRTINYGQEYLGNYNWDNILKGKTDDELWEIKRGMRNLPNSVSKLAEIELEKRKGNIKH